MGAAATIPARKKYILTGKTQNPAMAKMRPCSQARSRMRRFVSAVVFEYAIIINTSFLFFCVILSLWKSVEKQKRKRKKTKGKKERKTVMIFDNLEIIVSLEIQPFLSSDFSFVQFHFNFNEFYQSIIILFIIIQS